MILFSPFEDRYQNRSQKVSILSSDFEERVDQVAKLGYSFLWTGYTSLHQATGLYLNYKKSLHQSHSKNELALMAELENCRKKGEEIHYHLDRQTRGLGHLLHFTRDFGASDSSMGDQLNYGKCCYLLDSLILNMIRQLACLELLRGNKELPFGRFEAYWKDCPETIYGQYMRELSSVLELD